MDLDPAEWGDPTKIRDRLSILQWRAARQRKRIVFGPIPGRYGLLDRSNRVRRDEAGMPVRRVTPFSFDLTLDEIERLLDAGATR